MDFLVGLLQWPVSQMAAVCPVLVKLSLMADAVPTGDSAQMRGVVPAVSSRQARPAPACVLPACVILPMLCGSSCCHHSPSLLQGLKIT